MVVTLHYTVGIWNLGVCGFWMVESRMLHKWHSKTGHRFTDCACYYPIFQLPPYILQVTINCTYVTSLTCTLYSWIDNKSFKNWTEATKNNSHLGVFQLSFVERGIHSRNLWTKWPVFLLWSQFKQHKKMEINKPSFVPSNYLYIITVGIQLTALQLPETSS